MQFLESGKECFVQWLKRVEEGRSSRLSRRNPFIAAPRQVFRTALRWRAMSSTTVGVSRAVAESHRQHAVQFTSSCACALFCAGVAVWIVGVYM